VGVIKKAWRHPEADSLYVEEVEVGEEAPRQVVSGLVKYIPEAEMQMRRCVLVCNLKPANMRGVKSHAMVLAATSLDGLQVHGFQRLGPTRKFLCAVNLADFRQMLLWWLASSSLDGFSASDGSLGGILSHGNRGGGGDLTCSACCLNSSASSSASSTIRQSQSGKTTQS